MWGMVEIWVSGVGLGIRESRVGIVNVGGGVSD